MHLYDDMSAHSPLSCVAACSAQKARWCFWRSVVELRKLCMLLIVNLLMAASSTVQVGARHRSAWTTEGRDGCKSATQELMGVAAIPAHGVG